MYQLPEDFPDKQWVCTACGYNMIGEAPDACPFCGAWHDKFVTWEEGEAAYRVTAKPVTDQVTQLLSVPRLGLEHAAYHIETTAGGIWIDSPSAFNRDLDPVTDIYFTHKDFLGASNQYRALWDARVHLHRADAAHPLVEKFPVDDRFDGDFQANGIDAFHVGGHSPGWTAYFLADVLFACDYAFPPGPRMRLNPFGPEAATRERAGRLLELATERKPALVCGYNYVVDGAEWLRDFEHALKRAA
jgi:hydroxyacylglutathione hydrolase